MSYPYLAYEGTPLENVKVYTMTTPSGKSVDLIHITDFATICHRSNPSTRHLIEDGNVIRKLKAFRDRSRLMIPVGEILGYPLVKAGHSEYERAIYHYAFVKMDDGTIDTVRVLCKECSFGQPCAPRRYIEDLDVPAGDD